MIELDNDRLIFSFPEVHPDARLTVTFKRTLRIPDDGTDYPLPPGLGDFPLRHVDDFAARVPEKWLTRGGVMLPMYQSEAMWIDFSSHYLPRHRTPYPFAVKIATGKINAVSGHAWTEGLDFKDQDYMVIPEQPWLDGYCVEKGIIRQFVAMPLGAGYSAEEQITGQAEYGGLQIQVYPMRLESFKEYFPLQEEKDVMGPPDVEFCAEADTTYSLAPGGRTRQEIYEDPYAPDDWDLEHTSRCFVHLANSVHWRKISGRVPPTLLPTASEYSQAGLPWFDCYEEDTRIKAKARKRKRRSTWEKFKRDWAIITPSGEEVSPLSVLPGASALGKLKSVVAMGKIKREQPVPENVSAHPQNIVQVIRKKYPNQVLESDWLNGWS